VVLQYHEDKAVCVYVCVWSYNTMKTRLCVCVVLQYHEDKVVCICVYVCVVLQYHEDKVVCICVCVCALFLEEEVMTSLCVADDGSFDLVSETQRGVQTTARLHSLHPCSMICDVDVRGGGALGII